MLIDDVPGYRRRIHIEPTDGAVLAMLEDDVHCMAVTLHLDGEIVRRVEPVTERMPWDICPAAGAKLVETFEGLPLSQVTARREKKQNCTHLHDLAVFAAAHALERESIVFDILASDPIEGKRRLEIRRNGQIIHSWVEQDGRLVEPDAIAGLTLLSLRDWIASLQGGEQEAARMLQWGALVAHGRTIPNENQIKASQLPPNCFTLQPQRAAKARRTGERFDFSDGSRTPLKDFGETRLALLKAGSESQKMGANVGEVYEDE